MEHLSLYKTGVAGDVTDYSGLANILILNWAHSSATGSLFAFPSTVDMITAGNNLMTGTIPSFSTLNLTRGVWLYSNQFIDYAGGSITVLDDFSLYDNLLTESAIDSLLQGLVDGGTTGAVNIRLENNTEPSASGKANVDILRSRGCTVTVDNY